MNNEIIVKNLDIKEDKIEEILDKHYYIKEKIAVDILNDILVMKDLNNENKKFNISDKIFGKYRRRKERVDDLVIDTLKNVSEWLKEHEQHLSIIETKIAILADEIIKTQDEILKFFNDYKKLKKAFKSFKEEVDNKLKNHERRIKYLEIKHKIDLNVSRIGNLGFDLEVELFIVLDNILSGEFSLWYFNEENSQQRKEMMEYMFNLINKEMEKERGKKELVPIEKFYKIIRKQPLYEIKTIKYISSQYRRFNNKKLYDVIDLYKLATKSTYEGEFLENLQKSSHIREFITYEEMIKDLGEYFLKSWEMI